MRMLLKVQFDTGPANKAIKDGALAKALQSFQEERKPEASYFLAENGKRTALFFFDLKDLSHIPEIVEPFFMAGDAGVSLTPAMNWPELGKGLENWAKRQK